MAQTRKPPTLPPRPQTAHLPPLRPRSIAESGHAPNREANPPLAPATPLNAASTFSPAAGRGSPQRSRGAVSPAQVPYQGNGPLVKKSPTPGPRPGAAPAEATASVSQRRAWLSNTEASLDEKRPIGRANPKIRSSTDVAQARSTPYSPVLDESSYGNVDVPSAESTVITKSTSLHLLREILRRRAAFRSFRDRRSSRLTLSPLALSRSSGKTGD